MTTFNANANTSFNWTTIFLIHQCISIVGICVYKTWRKDSMVSKTRMTRMTGGSEMLNVKMSFVCFMSHSSYSRRINKLLHLSKIPGNIHYSPCTCSGPFVHHFFSSLHEWQLHCLFRGFRGAYLPCIRILDIIKTWLPLLEHSTTSCKLLPISGISIVVVHFHDTASSSLTIVTFHDLQHWGLLIFRV